MVKIDFPEPTDPRWRQWRSDCEVAREELENAVARGEKATVTDLYKDPRARGVYKSAAAPFYGKCAYCECDIMVSHPGDIEHWRPKSRVTDEDGRPIQVATGSGQDVQHPGYFWLAYDWRNLLFACIDCNRPSTSKTRGRRIGKWDQFPVRSFRASQPGDEVREEPLLLNPIEEDPSEHLEIDGDTGVVIPRSDRGRTCVRVFGLNDREALVSARLECIRTTRDKVSIASMNIQQGNEQMVREFASYAEAIKSGQAHYSAAGRVALTRGKAVLQQLVALL